MSNKNKDFQTAPITKEENEKINEVIAEFLDVTPNSAPNTKEENEKINEVLAEFLDVTPNSAPIANNSDDILNLGVIKNTLSNTLTVDSKNYFTTLENGTEISQKEYNLVNPVGKKTKLTVYDMDIITEMEKITLAMRGKDILSYVICKALANIQKSNKLEKHGFKSIAEFGKAVYGFESSTVNHYVKIGNFFLNDDYSVKTGLPQLSISHLIELNSLVSENGEIDAIISLYVKGDLVDGMSTKRIREVVKLVKSGATIEDKSNNSDNDESTSQNSDNSSATSEKSEKSEKSAPIQPDVINLEKSFDNKVAIAQILGHCNSIQEICEIMARNDIFTDTITNALKEVSDSAKRML